MKEIQAFSPDVVVTLDDNAFRTVAMALAGSKTPVVFSGLNRMPETYESNPPWLASRDAPGSNITGVI